MIHVFFRRKKKHYDKGSGGFKGGVTRRGGGGHPTRVSFFEPQYCSGLYFVRDVELRLGSIFGTTFSYYIWGHFMTTLKIYFKHFGKKFVKMTVNCHHNFMFKFRVTVLLVVGFKL